MRTIGVVTVSRSDYGIYLPILRRIGADDELRLRLFVGGTHFAGAFGRTADAIEADGFTIDERIAVPLDDDSPAGVARSAGASTAAFASAFERSRPDILVVLGDRYDMHAAAVAALPLRIPVAHVHGGESSEGAIDEALRHSLTKLSHLHFASTAVHARRIEQLGEEPWRVTVSGAPALDNLAGFEPLPALELAARFGIDLTTPPLLVTYHPATLADASPEGEVDELLAAVDASGLPAVVTYPGADAHHRAIVERLRAFAQERPQTVLVESLGVRAYFTVMQGAAAMIGNSSSGIIEAASFALPVVNVGDRQQRRLRAANVLDVPCERAAIASAIERALSPAFRESLAGLENPYGDGGASERIVGRLREVELGRDLLVKRFVDLSAAGAV